MFTSLSACERSPCSMAVLKPAFTQRLCTKRTVFTLLQKINIRGLDLSCLVFAWTPMIGQSASTAACPCADMNNTRRNSNCTLQ